MTKPYDLPQIRAWLIQGFSDEELRRLCHDTPQFRPVYHELARNTGKAAIVDRLLEYAESKLLLDDLLALVQPPTPAVQAPPAAALPEDRGREEINSPPPLVLSSPTPSSSPPPAPNHEPQINNPKNLSLPPDADLILKKMFADYWRVVILQEFGGGFSGSRIFLVQPQPDPQAAELRAVVKLASRSLIEKEWRAFRRCIRDQMPHITEVRGEPVLAENGWGGLRYLLLGGGVFEIESMASFCRRAGLEETRFALSRLLKIVEQVSRFSQADPAFHLQASYDPVLPVNLLLEPASPPPSAILHTLSPDNLPASSLRPGDYVHLSGFVVSKVDLTHHSVTLNRPAAPDGFPTSYCLRLQNLAGAMDHYTVDQVIEPLTGRIVQTRAAWLQAEAQRAVGPDFDLSGDTLTGPAGQRWPNPLTRWPNLLNEIRQVKVACIHGDLNLENIIVDPATRDVSLIDFAEARRDHLLHDLLRLETEIVTKLIPEILHRQQLPAETIIAFYDSLHHATRSPDPTVAPQPPDPALEKPLTLLVTLRKQARQCLFKPDDWSEYDQGLVLYLLGALKFANLDTMQEAPAPLPKAVAFWAAVGVGERISNLSSLLNENSDQKKEGKIEMTRPKRVFKITGAENANVTLAGNTIAKNVALNTTLGTESTADMEVELKNLKGGTYEMAGEQIIDYSQTPAEMIEELAKLLSVALTQQDQIDDLRDMVSELKAQVEKAAPERNQSTIRRLLNNIGAYLGVATLAVSQAEQAQYLIEKIKGLLKAG